MKYKTKIVAQNNGYIGHALLNEEIVYTSNFHKDTIMVVRELTKYISENSGIQMQKTYEDIRSARNSTSKTFETNEVPLRRNVEIIPEAPPAASNNSVQAEQFPPLAPLPRKCCGRG